MPIEQFQQLQNAAPAATTVLLAVTLIAGIALWLSGKRLARPACAMSGLLLGGLGGLALGQQLADEGAMALPLMIGTAIAGAILAAFLFRVWMGLTGAVILAILVPAASMVWQGTMPTTILPTVEMTEQDGVDLVASSGDAEAGLWTKMQDTAHAVYRQQAEVLTTWWEQLGTGGQMFIIVSALVGAGVGLLLGLILPEVSAAMQSAAIGAVLIFFAGRQLLLHYLPDQTSSLPTSPRGTLVTLGLITAAGLAIQWTLFRRRADK